MWKQDKEKIKELSESCGNTFAAINYVVKHARSLADSTSPRILDSKAISWGLTGEKPVTNYYHRVVPEISPVDDKLSLIEAEEIRDAVRDTLKYSKQMGHLIYCYNDALQKRDEVRVRVISRELWNSLKEHQ